MAWSRNEEEARMLMDIPSPMNNAINDQLNLKSVDICFDNMSQISCKSLLCFAKFLEHCNNSKTAKIWLVKFKMINFKIVYLTQFSTDFNSIDKT